MVPVYLTEIEGKGAVMAKSKWSFQSLRNSVRTMLAAMTVFVSMLSTAPLLSAQQNPPAIIPINEIRMIAYKDQHFTDIGTTFLAIDSRTWLYVTIFKQGEQYTAQVTRYDEVYRTDQEIRLQNAACGVHVSIYPPRDNPGPMAGQVIYMPQNQAPRQLGNILAVSRQIGIATGVSEQDIRKMARDARFLATNCPGQRPTPIVASAPAQPQQPLKPDEPITQLTPRQCNVYSWMGMPWTSSFGPIGVAIVPEPSNPDNVWQFLGSYGNNKLRGYIHKDSSCIVNGEWLYPNGRRGKFRFEMQTPNSFTGTYTEGDKNPTGLAANWFGYR